MHAGRVDAMPRKQLNAALEALRRELDSGQQIGAEDREALLLAMREIEEALHETDAKNAAAGSVSGRISALIENFETSHPKFAEILGTVSESLANLGI